jgi:protein-S-isoprenylcysteine O-methyltransferase Ste14
MRWLDAFILATYALQIIMICFFPVPSAGSTVEMLFKVRKDKNLSIDHPAKLVMHSMPKIMAMILATLFVTATSLLPLVSILFPQLINYLFPLMKSQIDTLLILTALLLTIGNALTIIGVRTLRIHVTFQEFGETTKLHTTGIYRYIRNPITVGLGIIYAGFFLSLPSAVMFFGFILFGINSDYRVRMEEVYLQRTFGEVYYRYKNRVGKYFPRY